MVYFLLGLSLTVAGLMSSVIIPQIASVAYDKKLFDEPGGRKVHTHATPRLAGISFVPIILFTLILAHGLNDIHIRLAIKGVRYLFSESALFFCGLILLNIVGMKDDIVGVKYRTKFLFQALTASFLPASGLWINHLYGFLGIYSLSPWVGIPLTILLVVLIVNSVNLIDGIDGLASGLCLLSLITLGSAFLYYGVWTYSLLAFATVGVLVPFFIYNVFGKQGGGKIFMGDTGSLTLGYIIAFLAIRFASVNPDVVPYTEGAIVVAFAPLIVPVFDVCRVIWIRFRSRKHLFAADRNHIHHKFLQMGIAPRRATHYILLMSAGFILLDVSLSQQCNPTILLVFNALLWAVLHFFFNYVMRKKREE